MKIYYIHRWWLYYRIKTVPFIHVPSFYSVWDGVFHQMEHWCYFHHVSHMIDYKNLVLMINNETCVLTLNYLIWPWYELHTKQQPKMNCNAHLMFVMCCCLQIISNDKTLIQSNWFVNINLHCHAQAYKYKQMMLYVI